MYDRMDPEELLPNEIPVNLFMLSFGKTVSHKRLNVAVNQIFSTWQKNSDGEYVYQSTGKLTDSIVDYLICFDQFLSAPLTILELIMIELLPEKEILPAAKQALLSSGIKKNKLEIN